MTRYASRGWMLAVSVWGMVVTGAAYADGDDAAARQQIALLTKHGIETDTAGLLQYLQRLQPNAELQQEITRLTKLLGDGGFLEREKAYRKLGTFGSAARDQLLKATKSSDPEVKWRAGKLLEKLDSGTELELRNSLLLATLEQLKRQKSAAAAPVLLKTIGRVQESYLSDAATQALWVSVNSGHAKLLTEAIKDKAISVRAAAVVALEIAAGDAAEGQIAEALKDTSPVVRLAAARALTDRRPRAVLPVLAELTDSENDEVASQSAALLALIAGHLVTADEKQAIAKTWQDWTRRNAKTAELKTPLGNRRLDPSAGRRSLTETFAVAAAEGMKVYGTLFSYEADSDSKAQVSGGMLRIAGDSRESDQRLFVTSRKMIGRQQWPRKVEVIAKLGAEAAGSGNYHVGVSIGRMKVLFHPNYSGGALRAETIDTHKEVFQNETMGFTPAAGVVHQLQIKVEKTADGAKFDVTVIEGKGGAGRHQKTFHVTNEQLGDYDRIGLERSGRKGGAALFDSVFIRLGA